MEPEAALSSGIYDSIALTRARAASTSFAGGCLSSKSGQSTAAWGCLSHADVGKSFVSANISASLSRDPRIRALAVDLDLRRGSLSAQFNIVPDIGLSDYFTHGQPFHCYRWSEQRLTVVPTRGGQVHSAELLASARAHELFKAMRASDPNNVFICDLPPVFANDDAVATMAHLDGYLLVSEEGRTTEREVRDAVEALGAGRLAGVVLNIVIAEGW